MTTQVKLVQSHNILGSFNHKALFSFTRMKRSQTLHVMKTSNVAGYEQLISYNKGLIKILIFITITFCSLTHTDK